MMLGSKNLDEIENKLVKGISKEELDTFFVIVEKIKKNAEIEANLK